MAKRTQHSVITFLTIFTAFSLLLNACSPETTKPSEITLQAPSLTVPAYTATPRFVVQATATPDAPHDLPELRKDPVEYTVRANDTLARIAAAFGISLKSLIEENKIENPDLLHLGQVLTVPPPRPTKDGSSYKVISDDLLLYSPAVGAFDAATYRTNIDSYYLHHFELVDNKSLSAPHIVQRVALEFSVNPKLLLALLEYQSQWLSQRTPTKTSLNYPLGVVNPARKGLYRQLAFAADSLNRGFYAWDVNGLATVSLPDDNLIKLSAVINAGTAAVQYLGSLLFDYPDWEKFTGQNGLQRTYIDLFGDPYQFHEQHAGFMLSQPVMQLPFSKNETWSFTGGPHGGWGDGSAWAALDFAPPGTELGCFESDSWVEAVADGVILNSDNGLVLQELDFDDNPATGWLIVYQHIATKNRINAGTMVKAGDKLGHPSCEGGISNGTHVHLARRYNGKWVSADGALPFNLDGWISSGKGYYYNGYLTRDDKTVEAWADRRPENQIDR